MDLRSVPLILVSVTAISFSGCSFDFDRERALEPGDVGGRALREESAPAPYARAHIGGTGREHRTRADGSFELHGLAPGGWSLDLVDDKDGDGWPERSARRTFTIRTEPHASGLFGTSAARATFVALGDVVLEGVVEASGKVLREDGSAVVGARVFALRSVSLPSASDGQELQVEQAADAETATDNVGAFAFPALPAGTLSFVAFHDDGAELLASEPVQQEAAPGGSLDELELRVSAAAPLRRVHVELVPVPSAEDLVRVHVTEPGRRPELLGVGEYQLGDDDVSAGAARLELDVPLGAWDVWVETQSGRFGVLRRQVASRPGRDALTWGLMLLGPQDTCAAVDDDGEEIRDCDQDRLQGLPPLEDADDPLLSIWRGCAPACEHAFGEAALAATCTVDGEIYDCDDDGDGQADVTESIACYGLGRGNDPDGDGLCGGDDPYPQCRENDPAHERCKAGAPLVGFPPPLPPELGGEETDAGPDDAGPPEEAGPDVDAGDEDGGADGGSVDGGAGEVSCGSEVDCSAGQVCHPLLGVCAPDCDLVEACGADEICTPGAGGYFCAPDCRLEAATCGAALCGADGMCSKGKAPSNGVYGDTWIWDGASQAWSFRTTLSNPRPRTRHVLAPNGDGVVMLGGQDHDGEPSLMSAPLLFTAGNWVSRGSDFIYGEELILAAAAGVPTAGSGSFYTFGTVTPDGYNVFAELPCCGANLFYADTGVPEADRLQAAMAHDGEGRIWLFGGRNSDGVLDETWIFDSTAAIPDWSFVEVDPPGGRYDHAFSYAGIPGEMLLSGGRQADGGLLRDTWRLSYDELSGAAWTLLPNAALGPRAGHGMSWDGARVVVYGGTTSRARPASRDVLYFDEVNDVWTSPRLDAAAPPPRTLVRMTYDGLGSIVSYGGELGPSPVIVHGDVFAGSTDAVGVPGSVDWRVLGESARPTDGAAFATAPDGALWVFGGRDPFGALTRQLHIYGAGGSVTDLTDPLTGPSAREGASMAFHPTTGALFLFGGQDSFGSKADLYRWDDVNGVFQEVLLGTGLQPSPRAFTVMAPSVPNGAIFLFGGEDAGNNYDDVWLLADDGSFSQPILGNLRPGARSEAAATSTSNGVYFYGGLGYDNLDVAIPLSGLWHFDGAEFSLLVEEGPPALFGATLTAEPGTSRLWLLGGSDGSELSSTTYSFDVGDAALGLPVVLGAELPPARGRHAAGFVDNELLLVGGSDEVRDLSRVLRSQN